jgi:TRAP-type transport system periplasmic protein
MTGLKARSSLTTVLSLAFGLMLPALHFADAKADKKIELKLGHVGTTESSYHLGAQRFADLVAERTKGEVTVKIFPNAQLGNERDLVEGLQLGTTQMAITANAPLSRYLSQVLLFDLPFIFRDDNHWEKVVDGSVGDQIAAFFPQFGFRSLGYFDGGWRSPYNSKRPIVQIDDIKGLKFRTMESPMHIAIYQALGAQGVPMASSEQYIALQQGVVDGSDAPISWYTQLKHYEIAKDLSSLPLFKLTVYLLISEKTFESLSPKVQKILVQAGKEASIYQRGKTRELDAKLLKELTTKYGVRVSQLKKGELDKFVETMRVTVWVQYEDRVGGKARINEVLNTH